MTIMTERIAVKYKDGSGVAYYMANTQEEFDAQSSIVGGDTLGCPKCATRRTEPTPGCSCRSLGNGHIMKHHHKCVLICGECGEERTDDDRVKAGMKCGFCAYGSEPNDAANLEA